MVVRRGKCSRNEKWEKRAEAMVEKWNSLGENLIKFSCSPSIFCLPCVRKLLGIYGYNQSYANKQLGGKRIKGKCWGLGLRRGSAWRSE